MIGSLTGLALALRITQEPVMILTLTTVTSFAATAPDLDIVLGLKHRGITHTLFSLAVLYFLSRLAFPYPISLFMPAGYASHLLADMLTPVGVPLFAPVNWNAIRFARIRTGGALDALIGAAAGAGCLLLLWQTFFQ